MVGAHSITIKKFLLGKAALLYRNGATEYVTLAFHEALHEIGEAIPEDKSLEDYYIRITVVLEPRYIYEPFPGGEINGSSGK